MKTLTIANLKGGVGKSTFTLLLAGAIQNAGFDVTIDDRDPQGSARTLAPNMGLKLGTSGQIVIVDTAPNFALAATLAAIREASLCVLPTTPAPVDIATTVAAIQTVLTLRAADRTRVLFNSVQNGTRLAGMIDATAAGMAVPVLRNRLTRRQGYQLAQLGGWKSLPPVATDEIQRVALELIAAL